MISVEEARQNLLALVAPLPSEDVPLREADGRVLARSLQSKREQPPFAASAMDGYAIALNNVSPGDQFHVIGEAAAGHPFDRPVNPGQSVRIFTGAPAPAGTQRIVLQEDVELDGQVATITGEPGPGTHLRPAGGDFSEETVFPAPRRLGSRDIALLAAMGYGALPVVRQPDVAIVMTGDELRPPGAALGPGQITASNGYGLAAMIRAVGGLPRLLPIASDRPGSLRESFALASGADLIVTIGGASVGDHDLVASTAEDAGLALSFHKVAMRPGKPLLAGRLGKSALIGLPGNPVSSMVCGLIFMLPMLETMLHLPPGPRLRPARLASPLGPNGPRQHYMRATETVHGVTSFDNQDSSLLSVLQAADVLLIRPPRDPARAVGDPVEVIDLPS